MEVCELCNKQFEISNDFINHLFHSHGKIKMKEYIIQTKYEGRNPICGCGCGEETKYDAKFKDFGKYKRGHQVRINKNYFGDPKNPKRVKAISEARKQRFASGEYDYIKEAVRNRDPEELGKKISEGAKGVPKPKPEGFGVGRIQSTETREKMSQTAIKNLLKTGKVKRSKLELKFEGVLVGMGLNFKSSFYFPEVKKIYDFYLPEYNLLIEVDGDFYHCHPIKFTEPQYEIQKINIINDKFKSEWATQNGYKLIRFWESEINDNPELVMQKLKEYLIN